MLKIYFIYCYILKQKGSYIDFTIMGFCAEHFGAVKIPKIPLVNQKMNTQYI